MPPAETSRIAEAALDRAQPFLGRTGANRASGGFQRQVYKSGLQPKVSDDQGS